MTKRYDKKPGCFFINGWAEKAGLTGLQLIMVEFVMTGTCARKPRKKNKTFGWPEKSLAGKNCPQQMVSWRTGCHKNRVEQGMQITAIQMGQLPFRDGLDILIPAIPRIIGIFIGGFMTLQTIAGVQWSSARCRFSFWDFLTSMSMWCRPNCSWKTSLLSWGNPSEHCRCSL